MTLSTNKRKKVEAAIKSALLEVGYNCMGPDMAETPARFARLLEHFSCVDKEEPKFTLFPANSKGLIIVKNLNVRAMCSHHLCPFLGYATIGYVPGEVMAGLSKFQRVMDFLANRLQTQEELTQALIGYFVGKLRPDMFFISLECEHTCMTSRGVQAHEAKTVTIEGLEWVSKKYVPISHDKLIQFLPK